MVAPQIAVVFTELRVTFAGRSWVPDIAVYRWERLPLDEEGSLVTYPTEPPDIAIEIVSPRQSANAISRRCLRYVASGVRIAVTIDSKDRSVVVYRPDSFPQVSTGDAPIDLSDVLPGFAVTA